MIRVFGCEVARELLQDFVDSELPMEQQVELEAHLRSCSTCAAHVEDLRLIGSALRLDVGAAGSYDRQTELELRGMQAGVLSRVRAERDQSYGTMARRMCDDLHAVWAGVGALAGVVACVLLTMSVISAVDRRTVDSLAEIIETLSSPGSEKNPMSPPDGTLLLPRVSEPELSDSMLSGGDAVFALATVVTPDGRIADYEVLLSHYQDDGGVRRDRPMDASLSNADVSFVREAVKQTRFLPPRRVDGAPVAANMVWLLARTTVKGSRLPFDFDEFRELRKPPLRSRS